MTTERADAFDFLGPRTLVGPELKVGDTAPDFTLINRKLQPVTKSEFAGKPMLISVVPSLDTPVCSTQSKRFDEEASKLGDTVAILTVSADLPFAQSRWCSVNSAESATFLSDHRDMSFGEAYGTLVKDVRVESRAVFVVDANGVIQYAEYVPAGGKQPDYPAVLQALQGVL